MPCDGVSVASAKVVLENEKYMAMVDQATIDKVVIAYLSNLKFQVDASRSSNGYIVAYDNLGSRFTLVVWNGRISVTGGPAGLETKLAELLNGLAGKMRQQVIIQKLAKAGVKVNQNQTASNGAIVLGVEL